MTKDDWLLLVKLHSIKTGMDLCWSSSPELAYNFQILLANRNQDPISDEICQILLINKKHEEID